MGEFRQKPVMEKVYIFGTIECLKENSVVRSLYYFIACGIGGKGQIEDPFRKPSIAILELPLIKVVSK
jgi:hypothetical protein